MELNRNNYEEYFILYMDNELGKEDRREVEFFAEQNPDLKAELDMLLLSRLIPDSDVSFNHKESLMIRDSSCISLRNYEEWLIAYTDNELSEEERKEVELFAGKNPVIQNELNLLQSAKLSPELVVFPFKESLYRTEERSPVATIRWWKLAAAAVLVLGIGTTVIMALNKEKILRKVELASGSPKIKPSTNNTDVANPEKDTFPKQDPVANNNSQKIGTLVKENSNKPRSEEKKLLVALNKDKRVVAKNQEPVIAGINTIRSKTNDLPEPINNPNINKTELRNIAGTDRYASSDKSALTNSKVNSELAGVTPMPAETYNDGKTASQFESSDAIFASDNNGKKNKLRGFFRKITRTFEKRTNIKATDEDDRLLIAGLAIKLN